MNEEEEVVVSKLGVARPLLLLLDSQLSPRFAFPQLIFVKHRAPNAPIQRVIIVSIIHNTSLQ
jgi:hypothetical protein